MAIWETITSPSLLSQPLPQKLYILASDLICSHLKRLTSILPGSAGAAILAAGEAFISEWKWQERAHGNPCYAHVISKVNASDSAICCAVAESILSVLSIYPFPTLPVILAIENAFLALDRKITFSEEEIVWLLQWAWLPSCDLGNEMMWHIKQRFLLEFLPRGRPRKSRRVLRRKLRETKRACKGYEFGSAAWTEELDVALLRIAQEVRSDEERVYGLNAYCYSNDLRLRSSDAVLKRLRRLQGDDKDEMPRGKDVVRWELERGKRPEALGLFRSRRRMSI